jgi:hypothetical protein
LVATALAIPLVTSSDWLSGIPLRGVPTAHVVWGFTLVGMVWLIHQLDRVARAAFREFRGALDITDQGAALIEYELTVVPAGSALLLLAISALRTTEAFVFQAGAEGIVGLSPLAVAIRWPIETVTSGLMLLLVYHTIRQLRLVSRLHADATRVDLFQPAPLYAFSRLTSRTAIGLVLLVIPFGGTTYFAGENAFDHATSIVVTTALLTAALLSFAVPLLGMHGRMGVEKKRLLAEGERRIESLIGEVHGAVDLREFAEADGQNKVLASLLAEHAFVRQLSTWPWQAGTARAVISAIVLPIALWVVTRVMARFL